MGVFRMVPRSWKSLAKSALGRARLVALPRERYAALERDARTGQKAALLGMLPDDELRRALPLLGQSTSQLNQDFFVLGETGWKRDGYFVEFGATDGFTYNNTLLLEQAFGWRGVLAEPAQVWRKALVASGRTAEMEFDCVWSRTGDVLTFSECDWAEVSTLAVADGLDKHERRRTRSYQVRTISQLDLLRKHDAPAVIDFLSIDTEGSEFEILNAFDFSAYRFRCIACEHNFSENRERIHALLTRHGYRRKFEDLSQFDDWYVDAG